MDSFAHQVNQQALDLARDILKDKQRQRRNTWFVRIFWALVLIFIVYSIISSVPDIDESRVDKRDKHIALIDLKGPIADGLPGSSSVFVSALTEAMQSESAVAVVIDANSPGGSPVQAAVINDALVRLKKRYKKPVYTVVGDLCASACYYALVNSDKMLANSVSLVGSIGVRFESYDLRGLADKIGVKQRLITAGENKAMFNPFGSVPDSVQRHWQETLDKTHAEFISVVQSGRSSKLDKKADLFSGLIWIGSDALELGLVDGFGDLYSSQKALQKQFNEERLPLSSYNRPLPFLDRILEGIVSSISKLSHTKTTGLNASIPHYSNGSVQQ